MSKMYLVKKGVVEANSGYIDFKNIQKIWIQYGENLILNSILMEIFSLDSSFLIQHQITINITALSAGFIKQAGVT
jgi:hypothetical protein